MQAPDLTSQSRTRKQAIIGPADGLILQALLRYHYLSSRQVCRLLYKPGSLTYVQTKLKRLTDVGFAQRLFLPRNTQYGSAPSVYRLARKALNYLKAEGMAVELRYHPSEEREHSYLFLSHTLAVNDVLIAAELICRQFPEIVLNEVLHERVLKRQPLYVEDGDGGKVAIIPDGWLDLRLGGSFQMCLALEVDQGTVEQKKWREKVRGLVGYAKGPYQEAFKTTSLTIAVVATPGEKRLFDLLRWTEAELEAINEKQEADLFRLSSFAPASVEPEEVFLAPRWYRPFDRQAIPLLDGVN